MTATIHAPLAFLDTETTGLHADRRAWEIAIIRRDTEYADDGSVVGTFDTELLLQVEDVDLSTAEPKGLAIGGFYDRHEASKVRRPARPWAGTIPEPPIDYEADSVEERRIAEMRCRSLPEALVARMVERATRGAHIVGLVPDFDTWTLAAMLRRHGHAPSWHYHLIDVEALAVGWLHRPHGGVRDPRLPLRPPWRSDDLSLMCDVEPPTPEERHTALGDARWAMRWYDAIMGGRA